MTIADLKERFAKYPDTAIIEVYDPDLERNMPATGIMQQCEGRIVLYSDSMAADEQEEEEWLDDQEFDDICGPEHACQCPYCVCMDTVDIAGETCTSCRNGAHQG